MSYQIIEYDPIEIQSEVVETSPKLGPRTRVTLYFASGEVILYLTDEQLEALKPRED